MQTQSLLHDLNPELPGVPASLEPRSLRSPGVSQTLIESVPCSRFVTISTQLSPRLAV